MLYSGVGSPGSAQGSNSMALSFGNLKFHSAFTPPTFLTVKVIFQGFSPYFIGIFPKSHLNTYKFHYRSEIL